MTSAAGRAADYVGAYPFLEERRPVWREIARYLARDLPRPLHTFVELGAGYCDLINQIRAPRRIAYDWNPQMRAFAAEGVELRVEDALRIDRLAPGSVDAVFASNFLEHLEAEEVDALLARVHDALRPGGRLLLIQPNHRRCADHYFDDPTHVTVFDDRNLGPWLARHGLRPRRLVPGLLPFSMKSRLPKWPLLVRLYLNAPLRPLAAQMYAVAERA